MIDKFCRDASKTLLLGAGCGWADDPVEFEVATVKQAPRRAPGAPRGRVGCFQRSPSPRLPVQPPALYSILEEYFPFPHRHFQIPSAAAA